MSQGKVLLVATSFVCTETKSKFQYLPFHCEMGVVNGSDFVYFS